MATAISPISIPPASRGLAFMDNGLPIQRRGHQDKQHKLSEAEILFLEKVCSFIDALIFVGAASRVQHHDCFRRRGRPVTFQKFLDCLMRQTNERVSDWNGWNSTGVRCMIIAIHYLSKVSKYLSPLYREAFFATAFMLAYKFNDDEKLMMEDFSNMSGFATYHLEEMEFEFGAMLNWDFRMEEKAFIELYRYFTPLQYPQGMISEDGDDDL